MAKLTRLFQNPFQEKRSAPPAQWWSDFTSSPYSATTFANATVNDSTTLGIPAAWRAVNLIADGIASSPLRASDASGLLLPEQPQLLTRPNVNESQYDTMFAILVSLLMRGDAYLWLGAFDTMEYPQQFQVLHPDSVTVTVQAGQVVYKVGNTVVDPSQLKHIRGFVFPGCVQGMGVVEAQREALAQSMSLQEFAARYFGEAAVPPVALVTDAPMEDDEIKAMQNDWVANHGRSRKPPVLTDGLSIKQLAFSPEDSQFLESRRYSLTEIALMFGVPGHFLGATGSSMTYTNVGQEATNLNKFSFRPWTKRIEQAITDLLPPETTVAFDMDDILRADQLTRYQGYAAADWLTVNEIRAAEGHPPIEGGDVLHKAVTPTPQQEQTTPNE